MTLLVGRNAVVVGGETGIGLAISEALVKAGAHVTIGGILAEEGDAASARLGADVLFRATDVRSSAEVDALVNEAASTAKGRLDILIYSAGVADGFSDCLETSDALWDQIIDINLRGCFFACRAGLRIMQPQGYGRIINISSIAALRPTSNGISYVAAKSGMVGLTRRAAVTAAPYGVTVNAICPGVIETGIRGHSSRILGESAPDMARGIGSTPAGYKQFVPAGRRGQAAEVAAMALYFAGEDAGYVTGQAVAIDGGWSAG